VIRQERRGFYINHPISRTKTDYYQMERRLIMANIAVVHHTIQDVEVCQRGKDGYFNATNMCKALKKKWYDFHRLNSTKTFVAALSTETGIPALLLVEIQRNRAKSITMNNQITI